PTLWSVGRPDRKASPVNDVWFAAAHPRVPHDGLYPREPVLPDGVDGCGLLPDPGCDVALGRLYRGPIQAGNRLRPDDDDSEHRPLRLQSHDRLGERLQPCWARQSPWLQLGHVDLFDLGISRTDLRLPASSAGTGPARSRFGDNH